MWVIKIGGSLAADPLLADWLRLLASPHHVPIVVVPGGGTFADCVRAEQARWRFGDKAAHAMALLAMAQFGLMLSALCPSLVAEASVARLKRRRAGGPAAVWLPIELVAGADGIDESWEVTSDSLAAWLARELDAERLLLVKSCAVPARSTLGELADAGVVDRRFGAWVRDARFDFDVVEKDQLDGVRALLARRGDVRDA